MSTNGHPNSNYLKYKGKQPAAQGQGGGTSLKLAPTPKKRFKKLLPVIGLGVISGIAELVGFHVWDIGTVVVAHPWGSSGVSGVAIAGAAATLTGRGGIQSALAWIMSKLELGR